MKADQIGFGIEIECNIPAAYAGSFPRGTYHRGIQSPVLPSGWNTQSDSSVSAPAGYIAVEIVSPVLKGENGLIQVVEVLDLLDQIGARTNPSCGLHVHVGIESLTRQQLDRLVKVFKSYEMAFYSLNGSTTHSRISNHYCQPSTLWNGGRYQSLNLTNSDRGHIEIRVWSGNLAPEVVVAAIYMSTSLVSRVAETEKIKTSDVQPEKPTQVMARFIRRFLTGSNMIVEDTKPEDIFYTMMTEAMQA